MKKIAFIGAGNMAKAIIKGLIKSELYPANEILVYNHRYEPTLQRLVEDTGVEGTTTLADAVKHGEILVLAVKPYVFASILPQIKPLLSANQLIVSIAAGVTIEQMTEALGAQKIVRVMPNTPAFVGAGMSSISPNDLATKEDTARVQQLFESMGKAAVVPETMIDAVIGVSGSSPAYTYIFIEALADGAVAEGMPRAMAYEFAAQAVLGAAKMVLDTNEHPGVLKDQVTSPGGTTIQAVQTLEENGFRAAVMKAVHAAAAKNREMS
ncbi:pyrroline-5-carboxylate reductase [Enterococcus sp. 8G7_MSG3316]|uniref:Pyrroline-5-carboxylate reductase n=1 Tax=Candidatus Enterococcus testudinis TaxID=1834191 RepID=A0A242A3T2_9ENTE|nr:pyrroline-5-carboxylate reductase [Enterococcus sp. 8G7_MSG3316]OTN75391.1 pyrroline-5-carboxylate reductase [Enterococcus sp. 8G7_MSG3316]